MKPVCHSWQPCKCNRHKAVSSTRHGEGGYEDRDRAGGNEATRWSTYGATKSGMKQRVIFWFFGRELRPITNLISGPNKYKELYLRLSVLCSNLLGKSWEIKLFIEKSPLGTTLCSASPDRSWCRQEWRVWHWICPSGFICLVMTIRGPTW